MPTVVLQRGSAPYPAPLEDLPDPPARLFVRGRLPGLPSVAIVGTRAASEPALRFARNLATDLARLGHAIVSGGALGIDAAAHQGALDAAGATVAVLATGVDVAYPREHAALFAAIAARDGALVSEREDGSRPLPGCFPARNRIIAALARCIVVVQAPARSGALSTARAAIRLGRPVLAVPWGPSDPLGSGCHAVLRAGGRVCTSARDVLHVCALAAGGAPRPRRSDTSGACEASRGRLEGAGRPQRRAAALEGGSVSVVAMQGDTTNHSGHSNDEQTVLGAIPLRGAAFDDIVRRTDLSAARVRAAVSLLSLRGVIEDRGSDRFARVTPLRGRCS